MVLKETKAIIVIAATNRSRCAGSLRFFITVVLTEEVFSRSSNVKGREAILRVHAKKQTLATDGDLKLVAQPGFVGGSPNV